MAPKSLASLQRRGIRRPPRAKTKAQIAAQERTPFKWRDPAKTPAGGISEIAHNLKALDKLSHQDALNAELQIIIGRVSEFLQLGGLEENRPSHVAGGLAIADLLNAIMEGTSHPLLVAWQEKRQPNRPWSTTRDNTFRALCCDLSSMFQGYGIPPMRARERVEDLAQKHAKFGTGVTVSALNKWEPAHRTANPKAYERARSAGVRAASVEDIDRMAATLLEQVNLPISRWKLNPDPVIEAARKRLEPRPVVSAVAAEDKTG